MSQMIARRRRSLLPVFLAGLIVVAAAGLFWHALGRPIETSPIAAEHPLNAGFRPNALSSASVELFPHARVKADLTETLARPLFRKTRRPYVAPEKPVKAVAKTAPAKPKLEPPPELPEGLKLVGIVELSGAKPAALMRIDGAPEGLKVTAGDVVRGWRITEIMGDSVTMIAGKSRRVLSLSDRAR